MIKNTVIHLLNIAIKVIRIFFIVTFLHSKLANFSLVTICLELSFQNIKILSNYVEKWKALWICMYMNVSSVLFIVFPRSVRLHGGVYILLHSKNIYFSSQSSLIKYYEVFAKSQDEKWNRKPNGTDSGKLSLNWVLTWKKQLTLYHLFISNVQNDC